MTARRLMTAAWAMALGCLLAACQCDGRNVIRYPDGVEVARSLQIKALFRTVVWRPVAAGQECPLTVTVAGETVATADWSDPAALLRRGWTKRVYEHESEGQRHLLPGLEQLVRTGGQATLTAAYKQGRLLWVSASLPSNEPDETLTVERDGRRLTLPATREAVLQVFGKSAAGG